MTAGMSVASDATVSLQALSLTASALEAEVEETQRKKVVDGLLLNLMQSDQELVAAERRAADRAKKLHRRRATGAGGQQRRHGGASATTPPTRGRSTPPLSGSRGPEGARMPSSRSPTPPIGARSSGASKVEVHDKYDPIPNWVHPDHDEKYAKISAKPFAVRHAPTTPRSGSKKRN